MSKGWYSFLVFIFQVRRLILWIWSTIMLPSRQFGNEVWIDYECGWKPSKHIESEAGLVDLSLRLALRMIVSIGFVPWIDLSFALLFLCVGCLDFWVEMGDLEVCRCFCTWSWISCDEIIILQAPNWFFEIAWANIMILTTIYGHH